MTQATYTAFRDHHVLAAGDLAAVALEVRDALQQQAHAAVLVFDDSSGRVVDLDLRGSSEEVRTRHAPAAEARGRGRPKLGVTAREVTLLPRHWEWLATQPGGASTALRKLVESAMRDGEAQARVRRDAAYRVMSALAGDLPGFEEASRALFAGDAGRFAEVAGGWPADLRRYVEARAF